VLAEIFKADPESGSIELLPSLCSECVHRSTTSLTKCEAFPEGIPLVVLVGAWDHHQSYQGESITFDPKEVMKGEGPGHPFRGNQWTKVGGQLGSNAGGIYMHQGEKHYVKFPDDPGQVRSEQAADEVYSLMGVQTMQHKAQTIDGVLGSVSKWKNVDILGHDGWRKLDYRQKQQAANAFVASALTKNWDVVGLTYDNMGKDKNGNLAILDTGGSFNFRAQGGHKHFGTDAEVELYNMLDPVKTSGRVFGPLMKANPEVFIKAARRLKMVPDVKLRSIVIKSGMHNADKNAEAILERKRAIISVFGI